LAHWRGSSWPVGQVSGVDGGVGLALTGGWVATEEPGALTPVVADGVDALFVHSQADGSASTLVDV